MTTEAKYSHIYLQFIVPSQIALLQNSKIVVLLDRDTTKKQRTNRPREPYLVDVLYSADKMN